MKKIILYLAIGLVVLLAIVYLLYASFMGGPSESTYSEYLDPGIYEMADQKVISIKMSGSPENVAGDAIGTLFNAYYKIPEVPKGVPPSPRARWFNLATDPLETWKSEFAMPVPEAVNSLSFENSGEFKNIELTVWEYGPTAVILHKGSYDDEESTVKRLTDFIQEEGYEIIGPHEEDYVKGPMPLLFRSPDKYLTLIRYRVRKAE